MLNNKFYKIFDKSLNKEIIITKKRDNELYNRLNNLWYYNGEIKYLKKWK